MTTITRLITYEDSLTMPENRFEEIVDGESHIMSNPTVEHEFLLKVLAVLLDRQLLSKGYAAFPSGTGFGIQRTPVLTSRVPDISVRPVDIVRKRLVNQGRSDPYVWEPPALLIECLSPSNRKGSVHRLLANYEKGLAPEVWLIHPNVHEVAVYHLIDNELKEVRRIRTGTIALRAFPDVTIRVDDLWAAFDEGNFPL